MPNNVIVGPVNMLCVLDKQRFTVCTCVLELTLQVHPDRIVSSVLNLVCTHMGLGTEELLSNT